MLIKSYPVPCRIDYVPSPFEPDDDGVMDVGYYCGKLSDGRDYRLECWRMDELLMVTVMFSDLAITAYNRKDMACLLEAEDIVDFKTENKKVQATRTKDDAGTDVWALNVMLSNNGKKHGELLIKLQSYK